MAATDESSPRELLRRLSLHRLLAFQDAVDAGSFAAASHHEPTRASLFSRQVTELEQLLGVQLLDRRGGRCAPTAAGLRLRGVVAALAAGLAEVGEQGAAAKVALTLAAGDSVLQWLVLPRVAGVLAEQPRVQLSLVASSDSSSRVGNCTSATPNGLPVQLSKTRAIFSNELIDGETRSLSS